MSVPAHCFLTGVEVKLDDALVLNRRDARDLLGVLKERVASLQRVIDQFSPLDTHDKPPSHPKARAPSPGKKHRLVCKAVADAMAPGFPEIELFLRWPEYRARARLRTMQGLRHDAALAAEIASLDSHAQSTVQRLGREVLLLLDEGQSLPARTRKAIAGGVCVRLRGTTADLIVETIRAAASGKREAPSLALGKADLAAVRALGTAATARGGRDHFGLPVPVAA